MTVKKVDWKTMGALVGDGLNKIHLDRNDLPAAFDVIRETIMDHLSIYIDKRHMGGFRIEIETVERGIHAQLRFEGETFCSWIV